jgi:Zinc knuckle
MSSGGTIVDPTTIPGSHSSTASTLRTVTTTLLEAPLLTGFDLESYRQWADVDLLHYRRIAKTDALPLPECIDIYTKKNFLAILSKTEDVFDGQSVTLQLADLDLIFSPYLESSQTLAALKKLKMLANADLIASYNVYCRDFDWVIRLAIVRTAAMPSGKKLAEQFIDGLWPILYTRMKALTAVDLPTTQAEALTKCRTLREAALTLDTDLMFSLKEAPDVKLPHKKDLPADLSSSDSIVCNRCGELGHYASSCPVSYKSALCSNCGKHGHLAKACRGTSLPSGTSAPKMPATAPPSVTPMKASTHLRFSAETLAAVTSKSDSLELQAQLTEEINELKQLRLGLADSYINMSPMTLAANSDPSLPLPKPTRAARVDRRAATSLLPTPPRGTSAASPQESVPSPGVVTEYVLRSSLPVPNSTNHG